MLKNNLRGKDPKNTYKLFYKDSNNVVQSEPLTTFDPRVVPKVLEERAESLKLKYPVRRRIDNGEYFIKLPFYFGELSTADANAILKKLPPGSYLLKNTLPDGKDPNNRFKLFYSDANSEVQSQVLETRDTNEILEILEMKANELGLKYPVKKGPTGEYYIDHK